MEETMEIMIIIVYFMFNNCNGFYLLNLRVTWLGLLLWFEFESALVKSMTSCTIHTEESLELPFEGAEKSDP